MKDDPEQPSFILTVTGQGYRFIAPLVDGQEKGRAAGPTREGRLGVEVPIHAELENRAVTPRARRLVLAAVGFALLAITSARYWHRRTDATAPKIKSIAVLPMKNLSSDSAQDYLADGMTEEIIGGLSAIQDLRVISRTSAPRELNLLGSLVLYRFAKIILDGWGHSPKTEAKTNHSACKPPAKS